MKIFCVLFTVLLLAGCGNKDMGQASAAPAMADSGSRGGGEQPLPKRGEEKKPIDSALVNAAESIAAELGKVRQILPPNPMNCLSLLRLKLKAAELKYVVTDSEDAKLYLAANPGPEGGAFSCHGMDEGDPEETLAWLEDLPKAIAYYQYVAEGAARGFFRSVPGQTATKPDLNRELVYKFYLRSVIIQKNQSIISAFFYFRLCEEFFMFANDVRISGIEDSKVIDALANAENLLGTNPESAAIKDSLAKVTAALEVLSQSL